MSWRHVAHTADVGIEVEARTREELFAEAAEALTALLVAAPDDDGDADADADDGAATEADAAAATAAGGAVGDAGSATAAGGAAGDADAVAPVEVPVRVPPGDDAAMLRDWLAEVLVAFEVDGVVGREFPVAIGPDGLTGAVRGTRFDPARHSRGLEVKAVTYHGLRVEAVPGGWRAAVLLDV
ncbi:MAG TPA: archease [Trueperaceae bacterium]|nr:archease [Trueperaceae bacterium]